MKCLCEICGWAFEDFNEKKPCTVCGSIALHELSEKEEEIALNGKNNWNDCVKRALDKGVDISAWEKKRDELKMIERQKMIEELKLQKANKNDYNTEIRRKNRRLIRNISNEERADKRTILDYMHNLFSLVRKAKDVKECVEHKFSYLSHEEVDHLMQQWDMELDDRINFVEEACTSNEEFFQKAYADNLYWLMTDKKVQEAFKKDTNMDIISISTEKDIRILFEEATGNNKAVLASFIVWSTENYWDLKERCDSLSLYLKAKELLA